MGHGINEIGLQPLQGLQLLHLPFFSLVEGGVAYGNGHLLTRRAKEGQVFGAVVTGLTVADVQKADRLAAQEQGQPRPRRRRPRAVAQSRGRHIAPGGRRAAQRCGAGLFQTSSLPICPPPANANPSGTRCPSRAWPPASGAARLPLSDDLLNLAYYLTELRFKGSPAPHDRRCPHQAPRASVVEGPLASKDSDFHGQRMMSCAHRQSAQEGTLPRQSSFSWV